jgi:hypothetical protein
VPIELEFVFFQNIPARMSTVFPHLQMQVHVTEVPLRTADSFTTTSRPNFLPIRISLAGIYLLRWRSLSYSLAFASREGFTKTAQKATPTKKPNPQIVPTRNSNLSRYSGCPRAAPRILYTSSPLGSWSSILVCFQQHGESIPLVVTTIYYGYCVGA